MYKFSKEIKNDFFSLYDFDIKEIKTLVSEISLIAYN
jgi:hypothetical protein